MTAIEKLRAAFSSQIARNIDPHEELIRVGRDALESCSLAIKADSESWQDDADEEPEFLTLFDVIAAIDEIAELERRPPVERNAEDIETDPGKRYMQILSSWQDDAAKLAYYKEQEKEKRLILFAGAFPNPKEGTQSFKLADGRVIKAAYRINRKVDEAALSVTLAHMRELGVANADALVSYKPTLAKREWNALSAEQQMAFSAAIIATPGTPTFAVEMPKGKK